MKWQRVVDVASNYETHIDVGPLRQIEYLLVMEELAVVVDHMCSGRLGREVKGPNDGTFASGLLGIFA